MKQQAMLQAEMSFEERLRKAADMIVWYYRHERKLGNDVIKRKATDHLKTAVESPQNDFQTKDIDGRPHIMVPTWGIFRMVIDNEGIDVSNLVTQESVFALGQRIIDESITFG